MPWNRRELLRNATLLSTVGLSGCSENPEESPERSTVESSDLLPNPEHEPVVLVAERQSKFAISPPTESNKTTAFAVSELQEYLRRATGVELPVTDIDQEEQVLSLLIEPDLAIDDGTPDDAFEIRTQSDAICLKASSDRALLFAVYDFLERYVGIRWLAPGEDGEVVPDRGILQIGPVAEQRSPDFAFRVDGVFESEEYVDWAIKNKLHLRGGAFEQEPQYVARRGGFVGDVNPHAFFRIASPEEHYTEHPEWYSDYENDSPHAQLDVANEDVVEFVSSRAIEYFDEHPNELLFAVTPNDGYGWPADLMSSIELAKHMWRGHPKRIRQHTVVSDAYFRFVNAVARRVRDVHPDKLIYALAYVNYVVPPVSVRSVEDNVVVSVAHYAPTDYARPITVNSGPNRRFDEFLREWTSIADNLWMYSYTVKYALDNLPFPIANRLGADIKHLHRLGYEGFYSQSAEGRWGQCGPHFYVMAKLLWDADRDIYQLLEEYFEGLVGPASETVHNVYDTLAHQLASVDTKVDRHPMREMRPVLTRSVLREVKNQLETARDSVSSPHHRRNIEAMLATFEYAPLYFSMRRALSEYRSSGELVDLDRAINSYEAIERLVERYEHVDALPIEMVEADGYFSLNRYFDDIDSKRAPPTE